MLESSPLLRRRQLASSGFSAMCFIATVIGIIMLIVLLYTIFSDAKGNLSLKFLTSPPSRFPERSGIYSALMGSLWVVVLTAAISVPIGVAAAIYLEELTRHKTRFTAFVELNISNLSSVPSIIYGLLGLALFVRWMELDRSVIAGALTMALLVLPMIITVSQEALRTVPLSYREGSMALGATQLQTVRRQVLPYAMPGILTGVILSLSRAIGETAPLIMIGAASFVKFAPKDLSSSFTVLPIQIFNWTSQPQEGFHKAAAAGIAVLMASLLVLNSLAIYLRRRYRVSN